MAILPVDINLVPFGHLTVSLVLLEAVEAYNTNRGRKRTKEHFKASFTSVILHLFLGALMTDIYNPVTSYSMN